MKILKQVFFIAVLTIIAVGCSSDDDNDSQTVEQMLMSGKWFLEKINDEEIHTCRKSTFMHFYEENKFTYALYQKSSERNCYLQNIQHGTFVLISDIAIDANFGYFEII